MKLNEEIFVLPLETTSVGLIRVCLSELFPYQNQKLQGPLK